MGRFSLFLLLIGLLSANRPASGQWEGAVFDSVPASYSFSELIERATCLDNSGNLHILMREGWSRRTISHISRDQYGEWVDYEQLIPLGSKWRNSRLVFNPVTNSIHTLLQDRTTDTNYVYHYYRDELGWHSEFVDSGYFIHGKTDVAIDSSGVVHISWSESDYDPGAMLWTNRVYYANNSTGSFLTQNITGNRELLSEYALRVDTYIAAEPNGKAHIMEDYFHDIHWVNDTPYGQTWNADTLIMSTDLFRRVVDFKADALGNLHLLAYAFEFDDFYGMYEWRIFYFQKALGFDQWQAHHPDSLWLWPTCFLPFSLDDVTIFFLNLNNLYNYELGSVTLADDSTWEFANILDDSYDVLLPQNVVRYPGGKLALVYSYDPYFPEPGYLKYYGPAKLPPGVEDDEHGWVILPEFIHISNYPNPFNAETQIEVVFDHRSVNQEFRLNVYNLLGQVVTQLYRGRLEQGLNRFSWNGKDDQGGNVSSGIYFVGIKGEQILRAHKMVLLK